MAKDQNHFFTGAIIGGIIGGLTALALSPKTGKEFRKTVMDQVSLLKEKSMDQKKDKLFEKEEETYHNQGIPLKSPLDKNTANLKEDHNLGQGIDKVITESGKKQSVDIEKILADTQKAFLDVEQKYNK